MISFIQEHLRNFLVVVMALLGLSFLFFGPNLHRDPAGAAGNRDFGQIAGRTVTAAEYYQERNNVMVLFQLQNANRVSESPELARYLDRAAWNNLLLKNYAGETGIVIDDFELAQALGTILSVNGKVDPAYTQRFYQMLLNQFGIGQYAFEEIIRGQLVTDRTQQVIVSPVEVAANRVGEVFDELFGPATVQIATLSTPGLLKEVTVTPDEVREEYEQQQGVNPAYQQPERRKISYVLFPLSDGEKLLDGDAAKSARNELGKKALDFALALEPDVEAGADAPRPDFAATAQKMGLTVGTTELFAEDEPAKPLPPSPAVNRVAFSLTPENPTSGNVPYADGFAVLKLDEVQPARPLAFEEVKDLAETAVKTRKANELLRQKGEEAVTALRDALAAGKDFTAAAKELGLTVTTVEDFVPGDKAVGEDPERAALVPLVMDLQPGQVSPFERAAAGGRILFLQTRGTPDLEKYGANRDRLAAELTRRDRSVALSEWYRLQMAQPGFRLPEMLSKPVAE